MFRTSQDFYNYFMMALNALLAMSLLLVYFTNYPNEYLSFEANDFFQLGNPERHTSELTLGFGGFFLIMSIVFPVLRAEGNKHHGMDQYKVAAMYILIGGFMAYLNYFPIATYILLGFTGTFAFLAKPERKPRI